MRKTIYVNGIVVGEVEATGDIERDISLIRDFLESKGLHREVTRAQAMFSASAVVLPDGRSHS